MAVLIDTSLLVEQERQSRSLVQLVGDEEWVISVLTVSELLHGVHRARSAVRARRHAFVEGLLAGTEAISITTPVARVHAELWAGMVGRGALIGQHDLWIAATALAHGLGVATRDRDDFKRVPGLRVLTPPA